MTTWLWILLAFGGGFLLGWILALSLVAQRVQRIQDLADEMVALGDDGDAVAHLWREEERRGGDA